MRYRDFIVGRDLVPLLTATYDGERFVVYGAADQPRSAAFAVPGRPGVPKRTGEEGGKPRVGMVVASADPAGTAVRIADFLAGEAGGYLLTDRRFTAFRLVPADPSLKKPTFGDGLVDLGRFLTKKEELPVYPMACEPVVEFPAQHASYQGVQREQPHNCRKADYHRIAFADGSVLGLLAS
ncbi:hypothetical protein [Glycomyces tritici]|uniref:Uncharacterized protein n=1 Tax=Glycomyces tritici TaxID=2665176 RepID=A0ABT7YKA4_9ACTN|nr:hypothetical protein [Glycomyces tritici]MDN3239062.1 hypothetical protein [Glycomyces tritici]MDN3240224.1 hypothetical protein [Glycomyces tritici]